MDEDGKALKKQKEMQAKLIYKVLPHIRKNGFQGLRMDEIARIMDVSRATLYKYFADKEEVVTRVADGFAEYIHELGMGSETEQDSGAVFQELFEQSVSLSIYITDIFLKELQAVYPGVYNRFKEALQFRERQLLKYYEDGIRRGIFNNVSGKLMILQDQLLHSMIDIKYLLQNQLTVEQVLWEYYHLRKFQLFRPEKLEALDDRPMQAKIEHLNRKITQILY